MSQKLPLEPSKVAPRKQMREDLHLGRWLVEDAPRIELLSPRDHHEIQYADGTERKNELSSAAPGYDRSSAPLLQIFVNGEPREIAAATLAEALVALDFADAVVATALNGEFVPKRKRAETPLTSGDRIEIVAPRQGG